MAIIFASITYWIKKYHNAALFKECGIYRGSVDNKELAL